MAINELTWEECVWQSDLTPEQRLIALALVHHLDDSQVFTDVDMLAGWTRLSPALVKPALEELCTAGLLQWIIGRSPSFRLALPDQV